MFVLLASPAAVRSPWVTVRCGWWLTNRPAERLLIVLTSGEWFGRSYRTSTGPSPRACTALRGVLREQPGWVDLRWLRDADQVDRANPRLRDCVADVVGAIRQTPKDLLVGEHIRRIGRPCGWHGVV